jgi:hypothetical protein
MGAAMSGVRREEQTAVSPPKAESQNHRLLFRLVHLLHLRPGQGVDLPGDRSHRYAIERHGRL